MHGMDPVTLSTLIGFSQVTEGAAAARATEHGTVRTGLLGAPSWHQRTRRPTCLHVLLAFRRLMLFACTMQIVRSITSLRVPGSRLTAVK